VTATNICGSDLPIYTKGKHLPKRTWVLGHENLGVVQDVGAGVSRIRPGDRSVPRLGGQPFPHVPADLAVAIADGADSISDLKSLRDQPVLFGPVASTSTPPS
jgi:NADPH:quinone reductase-like Zn-dependent oxidoreductase